MKYSVSCYLSRLARMRLFEGLTQDEIRVLTCLLGGDILQVPPGTVLPGGQADPERDLSADAKTAQPKGCAVCLLCYSAWTRCSPQVGQEKPFIRDASSTANRSPQLGHLTS